MPRNLKFTSPDKPWLVKVKPNSFSSDLLSFHEWPTVFTALHIEGLKELMTFRSAEVQCRVVTRRLVVTY